MFSSRNVWTATTSGSLNGFLIPTRRHHLNRLIHPVQQNSIPISHIYTSCDSRPRDSQYHMHIKAYPVRNLGASHRHILHPYPIPLDKFSVLQVENPTRKLLSEDQRATNGENLISQLVFSRLCHRSAAYAAAPVERLTYGKRSSLPYLCCPQQSITHCCADYYVGMQASRTKHSAAVAPPLTKGKPWLRRTPLSQSPIQTQLTFHQRSNQNRTRQRSRRQSRRNLRRRRDNK